MVICSNWISWMAADCRDGQHWSCAHHLMGLGPADHDDDAGGGVDDISPAGVPGWIELSLGWRGQIALSEHSKQKQRSGTPTCMIKAPPGWMREGRKEVQPSEQVVLNVI